MTVIPFLYGPGDFPPPRAVSYWMAAISCLFFCNVFFQALFVLYGELDPGNGSRQSWYVLHCDYNQFNNAPSLQTKEIQILFYFGQPVLQERRLFHCITFKLCYVDASITNISLLAFSIVCLLANSIYTIYHSGEMDGTLWKLVMAQYWTIRNCVTKMVLSHMVHVRKGHSLN